MKQTNVLQSTNRDLRVKKCGAQQLDQDTRLTRKHLRLASTLFKRSKDGIAIIGPDNRVVDVNAAYEEITGYSRADILGRPLKLLSIEPHLERVFKKMSHDLHEQDHWQGEVWKRHYNGTHIPVWMTLTQIRERHGEIINQVAVFSDISKQRETKTQLHQMAYTDPLTGLPNRACFYQHTERVLRESRSLALHPVILMADLDEFKQVNDTLGHRFGDLLLKQVADRMKDCLRQNDMLSRFGGDEFTVLLDDSPHNENHELVAGKLLNALIKPFNLEGKNVYIRASIGIYQAKTDTDTTESLIQKADIAMYQAKSQGKGCYRYYDYSLNIQTQHKVMLTSALHQAIEQNQLHLNYQVQVNAASGNPVSMEALLRWTHPDWGEVPPSEFIPLAETCGLIIPIGEWVLQAVCSQVALWQAQGLQALPVAINVSVDQFYDERLAERIKSMIREFRLAPELIEIEITESAAMNNPEKTVAQLEALKAIGITIAIDDFGTGYSSLSYLKKLPVSKLKVDREFVKDIVTDADNRAITNAVISLAHTMNLKVVAEGVETEQVRTLLIDMGCDLVQGFLFSRPVPAEQIPSALRSLKARSKRDNKNNTGPEPRWCSKHCEKVAL